MANSLLTGLVAAWRLNEASGNAIDSSANGFTLTSAALPGSSTGLVFPTARSFNGTTNTLDIADNATLSLGSGKSHTIAVWCKLSSLAATMGIVAKDNIGSANREFNILFEPSSPRFVIESFAAASSSGYVPTTSSISVTTGVWYLIIRKQDNSLGTNQQSIKVNNANTAAATQATVYDGAAAFTIGAMKNSGSTFNPFSGLIGPVYVWNRALTTAEDTLLWRGGSGLPDPFSAPYRRRVLLGAA